MTKTLEREIGRTVRQKRRELSQIREEVEDLLDYLDIVEARGKDAGKPRISHDEIEKRYIVPSLLCAWSNRLRFAPADRRLRDSLQAQNVAQSRNIKFQIEAFDSAEAAFDIAGEQLGIFGSEFLGGQHCCRRAFAIDD